MSSIKLFLNHKMRIFNPIPTLSQINWLTKDTNLLCLTLPPKMSIILPNGNGFWRKGFLGNDGNTTKGESCFGNRKSSRSLLNTHNLDMTVVSESERGMFSICRNIFSIISPSDPAAHPVFCQVFYFWREKTIFFLGLLFHFISFW